jgi:hypothetical protein
MNASAKSVLFAAGVSVIAATHIAMLNQQMPAAVQQQHALLNLAAVAYILFTQK